MRPVGTQFEDKLSVGNGPDSDNLSLTFFCFRKRFSLFPEEGRGNGRGSFFCRKREEVVSPLPEEDEEADEILSNPETLMTNTIT